jgi:hypothetical protein
MKNRYFGDINDYLKYGLLRALCTLLDDRGASAKENQELARHATPALTMNIYVRTRVDRVRGAVDAVGAIVNPDAAPYPRLTGGTPPLTLLRNTA